MIKHFKKLIYECFPDPIDQQSIDEADKTVDYAGVFECSDKVLFFHWDEDLTETEAQHISNIIKLAAVKYGDKSKRPAGWSAYKCIEETLLEERKNWFDSDFVLTEEKAFGSEETYIVQHLKPLQKEAYHDYKRKYKLDSYDAISRFLKQIAKESWTMHHYTKVN